jgi:hypothetical protein
MLYLWVQVAWAQGSDTLVLASLGRPRSHPRSVFTGRLPYGCALQW